MKIGIFTLPLHTNYGGVLQAYALQTVLEKYGHDVWVINRCRRPLWRKIASSIRNILKKIFVDHGIVVIYEHQTRYTEAFIDKYIHSYRVYSPYKIIETDFEAIVVGSDQIWRPVCIRGMWHAKLEDAFLGFARNWNIKRFSYAASFGVDYWDFPENEIPIYAELMKKFLAVSVREDSGVKLCKDYLQIDAEHVLDPTMLLYKEDYEKLILDTPSANGDLACYILDVTDSKTKLIERVASERGLVPFRIGKSGAKTAPSKERISPPIETWLRGISDSKFVITDSFHGCAFSIIFDKPFIVIGNKMRGLSRMQSLIDMFGLSKHLLVDVKEYNPSYSYVQPGTVAIRLEELRKKSNAFLANIK